MRDVIVTTIVDVSRNLDKLLQAFNEQQTDINYLHRFAVVKSIVLNLRDLPEPLPAGSPAPLPPGGGKKMMKKKLPPGGKKMFKKMPGKLAPGVKQPPKAPGAGPKTSPAPKVSPAPVPKLEAQPAEEPVDPAMLAQLKAAGMNTVTSLINKLQAFQVQATSSGSSLLLMCLSEMFRNIKTALSSDPSEFSVDDVLANRKAVHAEIGNTRPDVLARLKELGLTNAQESLDCLLELKEQLPLLQEATHVQLYIQMLRNIIQIMKAQDEWAKTQK